MASSDDIVSQMLAILRLTDPELDTSIGTTTRKILDAVGEAVAESYIDAHVINYQYDIDSKIGGDLDQFVQLFGLQRLAATRSTGTVTFSRLSTETGTGYIIPVGTIAGIPDDTTSDVLTIAPAILTSSDTSVSIPVTAVSAGTIGNSQAGELAAVKSSLGIKLSVTNVAAMTGGQDAETDAQLRQRWRSTVFRSLAGTEQNYLGIALDDGARNAGIGCYAANVVGASKRRREQIQILSGEAISEVEDLYYSYPQSSSMGPDIDGGALLIRGLDYSFDTSVNPPKITALVGDYIDSSGASVPLEGAVLDLDFEYVPTASRNNPTAGITNRIDVYCAGSRPRQAIQNVVWLATSTFNNTSSSPFYRSYFFRQDGSLPANGNVFLPLAFGPILTVPSSLTISSTTYHLGTDYWIIHQDIPFGLTAQSWFGLEWKASSVPAGTAPNFSITYTYNEVPRSVQTQIDNWRLVGTDAKAHAAKEIHLKFNLAIMYQPNIAQSTTNEQIESQLDSYIKSISFNGTVQVSDLLQVIHNVPGVDNVRFISAQDVSGYSSSSVNSYNIAIQRVSNGSVVETFCEPSSGRPRDISFGDAEVPVFDSVFTVTKAQNTFGIA
jgi:uncharacterized phage protein gp47/JayE